MHAPTLHATHRTSWPGRWRWARRPQRRARRGGPSAGHTCRLRQACRRQGSVSERITQRAAAQDGAQAARMAIISGLLRPLSLHLRSAAPSPPRHWQHHHHGQHWAAQWAMHSAPKCPTRPRTCCWTPSGPGPPACCAAWWQLGGSKQAARRREWTASEAARDQASGARVAGGLPSPAGSSARQCCGSTAVPARCARAAQQGAACGACNWRPHHHHHNTLMIPQASHRYQHH